MTPDENVAGFQARLKTHEVQLSLAQLGSSKDAFSTVAHAQLPLSPFYPQQMTELQVQEYLLRCCKSMACSNCSSHWNYSYIYGYKAEHMLSQTS